MQTGLEPKTFCIVSSLHTTSGTLLWICQDNCLCVNFHKTCLYAYVPVHECMCHYILVCTSTTGMYAYVPFCTCMYQYTLVCTRMYWDKSHRGVCTSTYWYIQVCTSTYGYVLVCTSTWASNAVGSAFHSGVQGPGFEPGLLNEARTSLY